MNYLIEVIIKNTQHYQINNTKDFPKESGSLDHIF